MAKPISELQFSKVPGFTLADFDTSCPISGEICPEKAALVSQYTGNVTKKSDIFEAKLDREVVTIKLGEYGFQAVGVDCNGLATDTFCPTRQKMNQSRVRTAGVGVVRNIMDILNIRGHRQ